MKQNKTNLHIIINLPNGNMNMTSEYFDTNRSRAWHKRDLLRKWGEVGSIPKISEMLDYYSELGIKPDVAGTYADKNITKLVVDKLEGLDIVDPNNRLGSLVILEAALELGYTSEYAKKVAANPNKYLAIILKDRLSPISKQILFKAEREVHAERSKDYLKLDQLAKTVGQRVHTENRTFRGGVNVYAGLKSIQNQLNRHEAMISMLASTPTMNKELKQQQAYKLSKTMSKRKVAKLMGVSNGTITNWLKNT
jgi:hypothetical protein